ncbi:hypothetical protein J6X90_01015 [Candidatus Saccharibacteria bacterium]|nr:hypothetical protein [Candidatus Saccharibacteria bacterium]
MSDTQNDDLQNAIDGIVNSGDAANAEVPAAGLPDLGEAPAPALGGDAPDLALPSMPVPDPEAGLMNSVPEPIEELANIAAPAPVAEVPEPVDGTLSETAVDKMEETIEKMPSEMSDVKKSMITDLIPLMDKVSLAPEKQYGFYKEIIDATHDANLIPGAYAAAKKIADDKERAEALLYLIDQSE